MDSDIGKKDAKEAKSIIKRMVEAAGLKTEADLARMLGKSPQAVANAKKKDRVPSAWIFRLAGELETSVDWLVFGREAWPRGPLGRGAAEPVGEEGVKAGPDEDRRCVGDSEPLSRESHGIPSREGRDSSEHLAYFCLRLVEAQDENRELMKANHRLELSLVELRGEIKDLKAENRKFREQADERWLSGKG